MSDPGSKDASSSGRASAQSLSDLVDSLPLTWPVPHPSHDRNLIPSSDVALEQDLLLHQESLRSWRSYISHVEQQNYRKRAPPDLCFASEQASLLGPLASRDQRIALRRIVSVYERAISLFPNAYALHRDYLLARARFVLGEPRGGRDALLKRINHANRTTGEVGTSLLESDHGDVDDVWQWQWERGGGLDGTLGYKEWIALVAACERTLRWMPNLPRVHMFYLSIFVHPLCPAPLLLTHARRTFDRSLRLLPASLHQRIWRVYLRWAEKAGGETGLRIWRRYLRLDAAVTERYVNFLTASVPDSPTELDHKVSDSKPTVSRVKRILEAAKLLLGLAVKASLGSYASPEGRSPLQLFQEWLNLVDAHPEETGLDEEAENAVSQSKMDVSVSKQSNGINSSQMHVANWSGRRFPRPQDLASDDTSLLPIRGIILEAIGIYPDQAGQLWVGLATYHLKRGELDLASETFKKGLDTVVTVRDFSIIFDAYVESQESMISYLMSDLEEEEDSADRADREDELDARMKTFEETIESRMLLVNNVLLRRNPHDVQEWEKRISLFEGQDKGILEAYETALARIDPHKATSNLHKLYIDFARFYEVGFSEGQRLLASMETEKSGDFPSDADLPMPALGSARDVFERAVTVTYKSVDDLAEVWIAWAEMELRQGDYDGALRVMARSVQRPRNSRSVKYHDASLPPQQRLFKSLKLWSFYADLEESIGTTEGAKRVYDCIMELKIANAQTVINYAAFLEERQYHEEAFKVYERGVESFGYPIAFEIWNIYLSKFTRRYGGHKVERTRDLFEQALSSGCPPHFAKILFLKYGALEEEHGLAKRAMKVYERATRQVSNEDRFDAFAFYIAKTASNFGLASTRPIYESAIEVLSDRSAAKMCLRFASLERKLGEIDRARAIYKYASQFCDPRTHPAFWQVWNTFEIDTGSEDTFREMLRIKRSVQAQYNTDLSYVTASAQAAANSTPENDSRANAGDQGMAREAHDPMARLEAQKSQQRGGVASTGMFVSGQNGSTSARQHSTNSDDGSEGDKLPGTDRVANEERIGGEGSGHDDDDLL